MSKRYQVRITVDEIDEHGNLMSICRESVLATFIGGEAEHKAESDANNYFDAVFNLTNFRVALRKDDGSQGVSNEG